MWYTEKEYLHDIHDFISVTDFPRNQDFLIKEIKPSNLKYSTWIFILSHAFWNM